MPETRRREPEIAASLVNGVRRTLIEDGRWERIEGDVLSRAPELTRWLAAAERTAWVSLDGHLLFFEELRVALGDDALVELGSIRLREDIDVGALARLLRAWIREFASDVSALLRVAPHAWAASTRHAGRMIVADSGPGRLVFQLVDAPTAMLERRGWHSFLEGFGAELLRQSGRQGSVSLVPDGSSLSLIALWSEA